MKKRVLVVEDEPDMREIETMGLRIAGYDVIGANNANDCVDLAVKEKPDIILMDIKLMYNTSGIEAARRLREIDQTRDIPIIFVTASPKWEYAKDLEDIANYGYITKPFEIHTLVDEIKHFT